MQPCWTKLCEVDVAPLVARLSGHAVDWQVQPSPSKPQRVRAGLDFARPTIDRILADHFPGHQAWQPMLSRMLPGQSHPMHVDHPRADCVTRVHVPLVTNPGAWLMFEEEGERVHFEAGWAYTFDLLRRHSFGNDGAEPRTHLIFDAIPR
ncbi:MAG: aspartyl/asparaginyl beta-hydroxylase domain-containing protein [Gemmataceae bacterium]|nr:aspartyl/asparaginyl beta-hydroxylase domain-containing protein [Gemmataceae bacterium]